jgi:hypothetical protein
MPCAVLHRFDLVDRLTGLDLAAPNELASWQQTLVEELVWRPGVWFVVNILAAALVCKTVQYQLPPPALPCPALVLVVSVRCTSDSCVVACLDRLKYFANHITALHAMAQTHARRRYIMHRQQQKSVGLLNATVVVNIPIDLEALWGYMEAKPVDQIESDGNRRRIIWTEEDASAWDGGNPSIVLVIQEPEEEEVRATVPLFCLMGASVSAPVQSECSDVIARSWIAPAYQCAIVPVWQCIIVFECTGLCRRVGPVPVRRRLTLVMVSRMRSYWR